MTITKPSKASRHPRLYTIFKPKHLITAKKLKLNFMELKVYNEILNNNHVKTPGQLDYRVPYEFILDPKDDKNKRTNVKRISSNLMQRVFYFDREFVLEIFGDEAEAAINPFPTIKFFDDHFLITLNPDFKKILTILHHGFTKGDIETLRAFNHEVSHDMYWLFRQRQTFAGTWEVDLEELKEMLNLSGKYEVYSNFKTKVLEVALQDFRGTWVEFKYTAIKKGHGGPVKAIKFFFANGPKQEKEAPAGEDFIWEEKLLQYGVLPDMVKIIRSKVKVGQFNASMNFLWDSEYVRFSLEGIAAELKEKKKSKFKNQVKNIGAWIYNGLENGQWLEHVNYRKNKIQTEQQTSLFLPASPEVSEPSKPISTKAKTSIRSFTASNRIVLTQAEVDDWEQLYNESKQSSTKTFAEFMAVSKIVQEGKQWIKSE